MTRRVGTGRGVGVRPFNGAGGRSVRPTATVAVRSAHVIEKPDAVTRPSRCPRRRVMLARVRWCRWPGRASRRRVVRCPVLCTLCMSADPALGACRVRLGLRRQDRRTHRLIATRRPASGINRRCGSFASGQARPVRRRCQAESPIPRDRGTRTCPRSANGRRRRSDNGVPAAPATARRCRGRALRCGPRREVPPPQVLHRRNRKV